MLASTIPNCVTYDPTFAYELAVIVQDGLRRMVEEQEDVYYYITVMNENYAHPDMPQGAEPGIIKGMYLFREKPKAQVQLLGSGTHPARSDRRGRAAGEGLRHRREPLERHQLHAAPARGARDRSLEPAAPDEKPARATSSSA